MRPQIACMRGCIITQAALVWLFSTVCFQMSSQMMSTRWCKVALDTFVWLFSTVFFQMGPQRTWVSACKVTLVAFVCLFSTVSFHMDPQRTWVSARKVTLVAFVWFFSTVCFQMCCQSACIEWCKITLIAFVWLFAIFRRLHCRSCCILTWVTILKIHDLKIVEGRPMKIWPLLCKTRFELRKTKLDLLGLHRNEKWKWDPSHPFRISSHSHPTRRCSVILPTGSQITRGSIDLSRASVPKTCICRCQRFLQQLRLEDLAATHHVDKLKKSEMSDEGGKNSGWENHQSEVRANDDKTRVLFRLQLSYQPHIGQSLMSSCLWWSNVVLLHNSIAVMEIVRNVWKPSTLHH